ncbi:hypothetical protein B0J15DRAFT_539989 [Fusarium solani]|uniref:DUF6546 domain-containing protein n=1 Tax=Fusarium solani TaxID=169388 RepID=A0A9P9RDW0_FUSSL|nr:uncharacterized protein B0J15DRAFT_539989 [Fusarium solani]KAH7274928.1 hypothetical protein B0J15DRAFT_539989 [Fusarium solani]
MADEAPKSPSAPTTFLPLPTEIREQIITEAAQHSPRCHLAVVSKEWQPLIEKKTFESLVVSIEQLSFLDYIKLSQYKCRYCLGEDDWSYHSRSNRTFSRSLMGLFRRLRRWAEGELTLEINAYSPSDSQHFFKGYYVGDPAEDEAFGDPRTFDDDRHGFSPDGREAPQERDMREVYDMMGEFVPFLDQVRVVKRLLIRRQCRRQFTTGLLSLLLVALPALEYIHYEPWRMTDKEFQDSEWYPAFSTVISRHLPRNLKTLTLFEDSNQDIFPGSVVSERIPNAQTAQALLAASLELEHLSASFMVDAQDFFNASQACRHQPRWKNLEFLALTSRLVDPADKDLGLTNLLYAAGRFALGTPRLRTMILWYGYKNQVCAFIYKMDDTSITWHGTREFDLNKRRIIQI